MTKLTNEKIIEINTIYSNVLETTIKPKLIAGLNLINWKLNSLKGINNLSKEEEENILIEYKAAQNYWDTLMSKWNNYELLDVILNFDNSDEITNSLFKDDIREPSLPNIQKDDVEKMTIEEIENLLSPPAYKPSENEILLRAYGYLFEDSLYDFMYNLEHFFIYCQVIQGEIEDKNDVASESFRIRYAENYVHYVSKLLDNNDDTFSVWKLVDKKWFFTCYVDGLSDSHAGDCTAIACSCMRCHAENVFNLPYTAIWSKNTGSSLLARDSNLKLNY